LSWQPIVDGAVQGARLILTGDSQVIQITVRSLETAAAATGMAALVGMPIGVTIGLGSFRGRGFLKTLFGALVGVPTVTLGLFLWILFSRSGPLGYMQLLYTVPGIAVGEAVLVTPLVISFVASAVEAKDMGVRDLARTLGASEYESSLAVLREAWSGVSLALVSSFNRAFAELGIALMIGGNIEGLTRVLTTAISHQTNMGELPFAFALSYILLIVVLALNFLIAWLGRER
jgi:tungstate transport system permease protein